MAKSKSGHRPAPKTPITLGLESEVEDSVFYARIYLDIIRQAMCEPLGSEEQNGRCWDIVGAMSIAMEAQFDRIDNKIRECLTEDAHRRRPS